MILVLSQEMWVRLLEQMMSVGGGADQVHAQVYHG